jgi:hypothetical protein
MSRIRLILLCALALIAVGAATSSSASASTGTRYFIEKTELTKPESIEATGGVATLEGEIGGAKAGLECSKSMLKGEIEGGGAGKGEISLKECKGFSIEHGEPTTLGGCTVKPIEFKYKSQLVAGPAGEPEIEVRPASGTVFTESELTGSECALKGKYQISGFWYQEWFRVWRQRVITEWVWQYTGCHIAWGPPESGHAGGFLDVMNPRLTGANAGKNWYAD